MDNKSFKGCRVAAYLLYVVSILGIINILSSAHNISTLPFPFYYIDLSAYGFLAIVTFFIYKNNKIAKVIYAVSAVIWFALLLGYLPWKFGHDLSLMMVFSQWSLIAAAYVILLTNKGKARE